jgi:nucleotide-binding universal stress UspA family protein
VVAAIDVDEPCDEVLDFAFAEAAGRDAAMETVYVWEEPHTRLHPRHTEGPGDGAAVTEDRLRLALTGLLQDAGERHPGVEPLGRVQAGSPAKILIEATRTAGLIVAGARRLAPGRHHRQWIGPVLHTLLHHAECAIAVVPCGPG